MANVEKMLLNEKQSIKATPKLQAAAEFDLNEGVVSVKPGKADKKQPDDRQSVKQTAAAANNEEDNEPAALDQEIQLIRRKTLAVRTDNVSEAFMQNIDEIAETVSGFQKMSEEQFQNDAVFIFQSEKDNYEKEIAKLSKRLAKTQEQRLELMQVASQVTTELEQIEYERE